MGKLVYGVGVTDLKCISTTKAYEAWTNMLERCYSEKLHARRPTYIGCSVHEDWLLFSNFKKWFDLNYIDGYHLDKDLFDTENKQYCPDMCYFVPRQLNTLFVDSGRSRGDCPIGVCKNGNRYKAYINRGNGAEHIGLYSTVELASQAYQIEKNKFVLSEIARYRSDGIVSHKLLDSIESRYNHKYNNKES